MEEKWNLPDEVRNPSTGQLVDRGRKPSDKSLKECRDSIQSLKRYIYRRITKGAFEPLSKEVEVDKSTLRRLCVWLQPTRCTPPTKTESICFSSRLVIKNNNQGIGTPAVLFPSDNSRMRKDFFSASYGGLKEWVYTKRCIPGALLELLPGKSFNKRRDSVGCLITNYSSSQDPLNLHRGPFGSCGTHGTVAILRSQTGFSSHYGNGVGFRLTMTANRYARLCNEESLD